MYSSTDVSSIVVSSNPLVARTPGSGPVTGVAFMEDGRVRSFLYALGVFVANGRYRQWAYQFVITPSFSFLVEAFINKLGFG